MNRHATVALYANGAQTPEKRRLQPRKTCANLPLDAIRRPRGTPLWKLEASLKCRNCRYAPSVHMMKLTETREITPYKWVHPSEERQANSFCC